MDLPHWIADEFTDLSGRLNNGVRANVPVERRGDGAGGTPITWNTLHIARHSALALAVLTGEPLDDPAWMAPITADVGVGAGLQESPEPWAPTLLTPNVDDYADTSLTRVAAYLTPDNVAALDLDEVHDIEQRLTAVGLDPDAFGWLYAMWTGRPAGWLIRWPLLGHSSSHIGEMLATRTRLGLSPF